MKLSLSTRPRIAAPAPSPAKAPLGAEIADTAGLAQIDAWINALPPQ
jgi:hypothetical protein